MDTLTAKERLEDSLLDLDPSIDHQVGPIRVIGIEAPAALIGEVDTKADRVVGLSSVDFVVTATLDEREAFLSQWGVSPSTGRKSTCRSLAFYRFDPVSTGEIVTIAIGTLVSTSGGQYVFRTTTEGVLTSSSTYYNAARRRYEVLVSGESVVASSEYNVAAGRVSRLVTTTAGVAGVENLERFRDGGSATSTLTRLSALQSRMAGVDLSSLGGIQSSLLILDSAIADLVVVASTDRELFTRSVSGAGLDAYVLHSSPGTSKQDSFTPVATTSTFVLRTQPVLVVSSVTVDGEDADYTFNRDASALSYSASASDSVVLDTAAEDGEVVVVTYTYDDIVGLVHDNIPLTSGIFDIDGIARRAVSIPVYARVTVPGGITSSTTILAALLDSINGSNMGRTLVYGDLRDAVFAATSGARLVGLDTTDGTSVGSIDVPEHSFTYLKEFVINGYTSYTVADEMEALTGSSI